MTRFLCVAGVVFIAGCVGGGDQDLVFERQGTVEGQRLVSTGFPLSTITFDSTLTFVGSKSFILYGIARCEIHLFAQADENREIDRLYWVQYEGYLPSLLPRKYDYSNDPYRSEIGGRLFFDSVNYYNIASSRPEWRQDSDIIHVFNLLDREGYTFDSDVMRIRLVYLDESRKNELMLMYMESMESHGVSIEDLEAEGVDPDRWHEISEGLRTRALAGMDLSFD